MPRLLRPQSASRWPTAAGSLIARDVGAHSATGRWNNAVWHRSGLLVSSRGSGLAVAMVCWDILSHGVAVIKQKLFAGWGAAWSHLGRQRVDQPRKAPSTRQLFIRGPRPAGSQLIRATDYDALQAPGPKLAAGGYLLSDQGRRYPPGVVEEAASETPTTPPVTAGGRDRRRRGPGSDTLQYAQRLREGDKQEWETIRTGIFFDLKSNPYFRQIMAQHGGKPSVKWSIRVSRFQKPSEAACYYRRVHDASDGHPG